MSEIEKRYRLAGKRAGQELEETTSANISDEDGEEDEESTNELEKRYRLAGKRGMPFDEDEMRGKRYRLMGKRYRLMGKRYRLMGKRYRLAGRSAEEQEEQGAQMEKRYRLMGKRYRLMGKKDSSPVRYRQN